MKSIQGLLLGLIAFVAMGYVFLYGFHSVVTAASASRESCLTMLGNTTRDEGGRTYIVGTIRNDCQRKVDHVIINFKIDRPADSNLGREDVPVYAYSSNVTPGETREFQTMFPIGKDVLYRYDKMTAY